MYKKTLGLSIILLSGCSTLSTDDDFSNAISSVDKRADYISVQAKGITPISNKSVGGNVIKNISQLVANYPLNSAVNVPSSYMTVKLNYIKAHSEYDSVTINGQKLPVETVAPSDETCSEHCTITQHISFPIDNDLIEQSAQRGLTYLVQNANGASQLSFSIPSGYFQAIVNERSSNRVESRPEIPVATSAEVSQQSKSIEMTQYWYSESTVSEQELFTQWAVANRKSISSSLDSGSKPLQMMGYWFEKATAEEKKQILILLLNQ